LSKNRKNHTTTTHFRLPPYSRGWTFRKKGSWEGLLSRLSSTTRTATLLSFLSYLSSLPILFDSVSLPFIPCTSVILTPQLLFFLASISNFSQFLSRWIKPPKEEQVRWSDP
jgi:hypothetical protein